jgi:ATP-dependent DNA helicase DinG
LRILAAGIEPLQKTKQGTKEERIFIESNTKKHYQKEYSQWLPIQTLQKKREEWKPCGYFDQLNMASTASHSIFNYSMFLSVLPHKKTLPERELLVLDEGHLLETEIVKFRGLSISKRRWKRYIHDLKIIDYGYDDVKRWIDFLVELETKMLTLTGNSDLIVSFSIERELKYNYHYGKGEGEDKKISSSSKDEKKKMMITSASDLFDSDEEIAEKYDDGISKESISKLGDELTVDAIRDIEKLTRAINNILANPKNWIVSEIIKENYEVMKVELKPLDISPYCKPVFEKCSKILIMSATILNHKAFCRSVGLNADDVKFTQVRSDFPVEHRPIYPLNVAYLNYNNLQSDEVKLAIAKTVDNIMSFHANVKGIIHTTSYEQLNFIKENISQLNARRLLVTDPEIQRDEVIFQHTSTTITTMVTYAEGVKSYRVPLYE